MQLAPIPKLSTQGQLATLPPGLALGMSTTEVLQCSSRRGVLLCFLIEFIKIACHGLSPGVPKASCVRPLQGAAVAKVH